MNEARDFGASLRRERERHGITLNTIAEQTKVAASLLAGLERGDVSRWPSGIFRRAFVRSYAAAVGLDVEDTLASFLRIFPDDGSEPRPWRPLPPGTRALRLALAEHGGPKVDWRRLGGAGVDLLLVGLAAVAGWGAASWAGAGVAALAAGVSWHTAGTLLWGTSPGVRLLTRRAPMPSAAPVSELAIMGETEPAAARPEPARSSPVLSVVSTPRARITRRERRVMGRAERARPSPH